MKVNPSLDPRIGRPGGGRVADGKKGSRADRVNTPTNLPPLLPRSSAPPPLPGRYEVHNFWAQLQSVQQQTTSAQVSLQALFRARQLMTEFHNSLELASEEGNDAELQRTMTEQRKQLARFPDKVRYQGVTLLTTGFQPKILGYQSLRVFQIKGLNLLVAAERDELMELVLTSSKARRAGLFIKGGSELAVRVRQIDRGFSRLGIHAHLNEKDKLQFRVPSEQWPLINERLYIRGGGVRVPTGQPVKLQLIPEISPREPGHWQFKSELDLAKSRLKVKKLISEVSTHIQILQQMQAGWLQQLRNQSDLLPLSRALAMANSAAAKFAPNPANPYAALSAIAVQANLGRSGVQAILETELLDELPPV